jgi:hypothetical protein
MSTSVTVSKDEIGEKAFDIATLIGLLDENGDLQTDWFSSPLTQLEAAPGRAKTLIQSIQSFLGPRAETNAPVFTGAEWYEIRNPSTGNATGFYVVTPEDSSASVSNMRSRWGIYRLIFMSSSRSFGSTTAMSRTLC